MASVVRGMGLRLAHPAVVLLAQRLADQPPAQAPVAIPATTSDIRHDMIGRPVIFMADGRPAAGVCLCAIGNRAFVRLIAPPPGGDRPHHQWISTASLFLDAAVEELARSERN